MASHQPRPAFVEWLKQPWVISVAVVVVLLSSVGAYAVLRAKVSPAAQLYLDPAKVSVDSGATFSVDVRENSTSTPINAVQANLHYDQAKLQYVDITDDGTAFGIQAQGTGGGGSVAIARATSGGAAPVSGRQKVATVTFRALASSGSATISFASGSAIVQADHSTALAASLGSATVHFAAGTAATAGQSPSATPTPTSTPASHAATPTPVPAAAGATTMYLTPASAAVSRAGELTFDIHENSLSTAINAVQADFSYPTDKFEVESISGSHSDFGLAAQDSGDHGHIVIIRAITPGSPTLTGDHIVATVTLKANGTGAAAVTPAGGSALLTASNSTNVLKNVTGGSYTISN